MNTALFQALSQSIIISLGHALVVYLLVRVILLSFKDLASSWRYNILYSSLVLICAGFLISLFRYYIAAAEVTNLNAPAAFSTVSTAKSASILDALIRPYSVWIAWTYFVGLVIQAFFLLVSFYRLKSRYLTECKPAPPFWSQRLRKLQQHLHVSKTPALYFSDKILIPFTAGFLKPVILFPLATLNQLSIDQVEAILLHELAHIKRSDYLMNIFQRIMEIILFFNPVIWLIAKEIKAEREYCCDDIVVRYTADPNGYARALSVIEQYKLSNSRLAMAVTGDRKYQLLNRILKITTMKTQNPSSKSKLFALLGILAISSSLAWVMPADTLRNKQSKNQTPLQTIQAPGQPSVPPALPAPPATGPIEILKSPRIPGLPNPAPPAPPTPVAPMDTNELKKQFNSPEWKKQVQEMKIETEKLKKHFDSPEWKKEMQAMKVETEKLKKQFDSPEWKKQMEGMKVEAEKMKKQFNSPEWKKQMEDMKISADEMKKQFSSPEWKKQMEHMKIAGEKMKKQFDSPEWKKQMEQMKVETENMKKQFNSPEWKKQMEDLKVETEKMKKEFNSPEWKKKMKELELKEDDNKEDLK